jgi:threonine dehydrogenase-like Zn-dependent dehydrogenase
MADHVTFEEEAMRDILAVAVHAVGRSRLPREGTVLCIGGGPAGLSVAQVALARGAGRVFVSEPSPAARRVLSGYDGLTVIDPNAMSVAEATQRIPLDAIFDSVGTPATMTEFIPLLSPGGVYVNLAVHDAAVSLNAMLLGQERWLTSSSNALYRDEREAHTMIASGDVDVGSMITHKFPLEAFDEAYELLLARPKRAYKVVFTC